jgi:signal transduction histidine kinase
MANTAKHAKATTLHVEARTEGSRLHLTVRDDGIGGAAPAPGSGLLGLRDRVEALGGTLSISSPPGGGTELGVDLPG